MNPTDQHTLLQRVWNWIHNNRVAVVILVFAAAVVGLAQLTDAVDKLRQFVGYSDPAVKFVVKLDRTTGGKVWAFQMSADNSANSGAFGVATDRQGNLYVAGRTAGSLDGQPSAGGYDGFLVKLDKDGNRLWTRLIGTPADDYAFDVSLDAAGNAYVTGSTGGALAGASGLGGSDAFVAKFSPDGVRR